MRIYFLPLLLILFIPMSIAYDIAVEPSRVAFNSWHFNTQIYIYNNLPYDVNATIEVLYPTTFTKYNDTGIYTSLTEGEDLKEFEKLPDLSWVIVENKNITLPKKWGNLASVTVINITVNIPKKKEYAGKHYEFIVAVNPDIGELIKPSLASRILIITPEIHKTSFPSFIWVIFVFIAVLFIKFVKRCK